MSQQRIKIPKRMMQMCSDIVVDTPISPRDICRMVLVEQNKPEEPEKTADELIADAIVEMNKPAGIYDLIGKRIIRTVPLLPLLHKRDVYVDGAFCVKSAGGTGIACTLHSIDEHGSMIISYLGHKSERLLPVWSDNKWVEYIEGVAE
jgi:hypothetical protein